MRPETTDLISNGSSFVSMAVIAVYLTWTPAVPTEATPPAMEISLELAPADPPPAMVTPAEEPMTKQPPPVEEPRPMEEPEPSKPLDPPPPAETPVVEPAVKEPSPVAEPPPPPPPPPDAPPTVEVPPPKPPEPPKAPERPKPKVDLPKPAQPRVEPPKPHKPVEKAAAGATTKPAAAPPAKPAAPRAGSGAQFNACLQSRARYPSSKEARLQNPHGSVGVSVTLSGASITGVSITSSSGSALLDQAARSSILASGCGPLAGGALSLSGRIVF